MKDNSCSVYLVLQLCLIRLHLVCTAAIDSIWLCYLQLLEELNRPEGLNMVNNRALNGETALYFAAYLGSAQ